MFLIRLFRFLSGYVIFTGTGGFPERFINLCSKNGISLWDAKAVNGIIQAKTNISGYKKIRTCAKRSGMRIRMQKKCGLPFLAAPYLRRKGLFAGAAISVVFIILLTSTVWTTEVTGNEKFTNEQIIAIAKSYGVHSGAFKRNIDVKQIRSDIKATVNGISWFSVNTDGSHISLEVSETSGTNEILDMSDPCNVISEIDGEVLKIETFTGTPAVSPGSAVVKGDLLISGVMEKTDGSSYFVHARGIATIRTNSDIAVNLPYNLKVKKIKNIKNRYWISIFGINIPMGFVNSSELIRKSHAMLEYRDIALPVGIITDQYLNIIQIDNKLNEEQTTLLGCFSSFKQEMKIMQNAEIETKTTEIKKQNNGILLNSHYIIHKKTGTEHYFEVTE